MGLAFVALLAACDDDDRSSDAEPSTSFTLTSGYFQLVGGEVGCLYSPTFLGVACAGVETSTYHFSYGGPAEEESGSFTAGPPFAGPTVTFRRSFVRRARNRKAFPGSEIRCEAVRVRDRVGLRCRNSDSAFTLTRSTISGDFLPVG